MASYWLNAIKSIEAVEARNSRLRAMRFRIDFVERLPMIAAVISARTDTTQSVVHELICQILESAYAETRDVELCERLFNITYAIIIGAPEVE